MKTVLTALVALALCSLPTFGQSGEALAGTWDNADPDTRSIKRIVIEEGAGGLLVRAFGACGGALCDLGPASEAAALGESPGDPDADSFLARWDFGFSVLTLSGVRADLFAGRDADARVAFSEECPLVVALQDVFRDDSGRSNYLIVKRYCRGDDATTDAGLVVVGPERWLHGLRGFDTK